MAPSFIERGTLSYFLVNLARKGDELCKENDSPNPLYTGLRSLVCQGDLGVLRAVDEWGPVGMPYYAFILIDYYLLLHKADLDTALKVYEWLKGSYEKHPYVFDPDERCGLRILEWLVEGGRDPRGLAPREIARGLERVQCPPNGWGGIFKEMVLGHLLGNLEERLRHLNHALVMVRRHNLMVVDEDVAKAYNLVLPKWGLEVVGFFEGALSSLAKKTLSNTA